MTSVKELNLKGKRVLVRVDYNLPMDKKQRITDDNRIAATLPMLEYLIKADAKVIIISHMGRPKGKPVPELSLEPAARHLSSLLDISVDFASDCIGPDILKKVNSMEEGQVMLLENLRFHGGETANDPGFAKELAGLCDVYINDAFAVSHRSQASVVGIPPLVRESAAGFLLEKELEAYDRFAKSPQRPLVAVIGGAKVSGKLEALENMLGYVDKMIIGGAMANTFLKSQGMDMGTSRIEMELLDTAAGIISDAQKKGVRFILPVDLVVAEAFDKDALARNVPVGEVPQGWMAMDIGEKSAKLYADELKEAATIVWNGPMGVFEMERFSAGTCAVARAATESNAFSIVGGGDTALAVSRCGVAEKISYISTGGGAFLHLMEGKELPGSAALEKGFTG